jgi:hypothetical protein
MNKKSLYIVVGIAVVACAIAGAYLFIKFQTTHSVASPAQPFSKTALLDPLNATYLIDGSPITLTNGKAEQASAPGSSETTVTRIFGTPVLGDMNGDGVNDAAVIITEDGGGSGTFYYAAVTLGGTSNGTAGTNAILLGDRISPDTMQIANGILTVNYADRKPGDPMSTMPSVGVSKYLVIAGKTLYDAPIDIYPLPSGITWNEMRAATVAPGDENVPGMLAGIKITSQPITNITDLSAPSAPFEKYYKAKLVAAGWTEDNSMAAGGPGAEIVGYKKGNDYIILEYASIFKNKGDNSPETCPCDMTFSIFAGTLETKV